MTTSKDKDMKDKGTMKGADSKSTTHSSTSHSSQEKKGTSTMKDDKKHTKDSDR